MQRQAATPDLKIVVRAVGKMRDRRLFRCARNTAARVRRHVPVEIGEVEDDAALLRGLPPGTEIIALEPGGDAWTTAEFTKYLERRMVQGTRALAFLIGGADGLAPATVKRAQRRLSLCRSPCPIAWRACFCASRSIVPFPSFAANHTIVEMRTLRGRGRSPGGGQGGGQVPRVPKPSAPPPTHPLASLGLPRSGYAGQSPAPPTRS